MVPFSDILSFLPNNFIWVIHMGAVGILFFSIFRKFNPKKKGPGQKNNYKESRLELIIGVGK
jgi:hypothetical protein